MTGCKRKLIWLHAFDVLGDIPYGLAPGTLLTGLIKCGCCNSGMTTATGKGGRYRYYKCNTRIAKHINQCSNPAVSMPTMDAAVLDVLADKLFTPERVKDILGQLQKQIKNDKATEADEIKVLQVHPQGAGTAERATIRGR